MMDNSETNKGIDLALCTHNRGARQCPLVKAYRGRTNITDKSKFVVILKGPCNSMRLTGTFTEWTAYLMMHNPKVVSLTDLMRIS